MSKELNWGVVFLLFCLGFIPNCQSVLKNKNDRLIPQDTVNIFQYNQNLGRGINLGNALEAPTEGEWGVVLQAEYFDSIKQAGFQTVRIPIRWSAHTSLDSPFTISGVFFNRVDWAISQALAHDLNTIINIHHYNEIMESPESHTPRLKSMWHQIASHYQSYPLSLSFELLNEPHAALTPQAWNDLIPELIALIRQSNPHRPLIIGTANWGGIGALSELKIDSSFQNIIVTIHYYEPFQFTHQGAEWVDGSENWLGNNWTGTGAQIQALYTDFDLVRVWSQQHQRPILIGEFGAYRRADQQSRALWTAAVRRTAEQRQFSWAYWEFCAGFGAYDREKREWRRFLLEALIPGE